MNIHRNLLAIPFAIVICLLASTSIHAQKSDSKKFFGINKANSLKIPPKKEMQLVKAFKKGYGKSLGYESLTLEKIKGKVWLVVSGNKGNLGIPLVANDGMQGIDLGGPLGAVNCITTNSCECCKASSCGCSKKNGGQVDCGSSSCEKREVDVMDTGTAEILSSYL